MTANGFKWFLIGVLCAILFACLVETSAEAEEVKAKTRQAPVVTQAVNGVMLQIGWQEYQELDDAVVLYCIKRKDKVLLDCVVYIAVESGAGITLIEDILPTEEHT